MKRLVVTTLFAAIVGLATVAQATTPNGSTPAMRDGTRAIGEDLDVRESIEAGYAKPGSVVHRWVASLGYALLDDQGFSYEFYSTNSQGGAFESLLARLEKVGSFQKTIQFDPPQPTQGGQIGQTWATTVPCLNISYEGSYGTASITIQWERRYTTDSDSDGTNDANPKWVVSSFSTSNVEWFTHGAALCA